MISCDDALLAIAEAFGNSLHGRTMIQKVGYFIAVQTNSDLGYAPHYYGPYSATMAATISERVQNGDLQEKVIARDADFLGNDEVRKFYEYDLTKTGQSAIQIHRSWHPEEFDQAVGVAKAIRDLKVDYMQLSFAAKVHCISRQQKTDLNVDSIREKAAEMGWKMTPKDVDQGVSILKKLGFLPGQN